MPRNDSLYVGIDLGTTNSVIAVINEKPNGDIISKVLDIPRPCDIYNNTTGEPILSTDRKSTLPSCIYYRQEKNYEPIVGDFAKRQYPLRPHLVSKSIKSQMGKPLAEGLSPDIPDKTPAEISSRILSHMIKEASRMSRCHIEDAIITVPANFDPSMCQATRDAAELAGIHVRYPDGREKPILLSEPNAVIYDLINQIHNGDISNHIIDLSSRKRVLVFDLGGGTLDITMHEIQRREGMDDILKVDEIATNRYTLLGGDDFDNEIAKVMYEHYLKQYQSHKEAVLKLRKEEAVIMAQLRVFAENLKLELNQRCGDSYDDDSGWYDEEETFPTGGNMGGIGYSYDDDFTKEELESILSIFMAEDLVFSDYKRIDEITSTKNIIYPILDVLQKASEKLGEDDIVVDEVIVNGGMSKFYMVIERLKKFFGKDPIVALDPDLAVARGAAVYHYYLNKYGSIMEDDMKNESDTSTIRPDYEKNGTPRQPGSSHTPTRPPHFVIGKTILNDALYIGLKNGAVQQIIPSSAALPYTSEVMTGFQIQPNQPKVSIPIQSRNLDGTYRKISSGNITFKRNYKNGAYVAFQIHMGQNKVISIKAWTSQDVDGRQVLEEGTTDISIENNTRPDTKIKLISQGQNILDPKAEISSLLQLCNNENSKNSGRNNIKQRIEISVKTICSAKNKDAFADEILKVLGGSYTDKTRERFFTIARKIGADWPAEKLTSLSKICMSQINGVLNGFLAYGSQVNTNIQAIHALSICASPAQLEKISELHKIDNRYLHACMYTFARRHANIDMIAVVLEEDIKKAEAGTKSHLQASAYAIGVALMKGSCPPGVISEQKEQRIITMLCDAIQTRMLTCEELVCCLLALGWICDQRYQTWADTDRLREVIDTVENINNYYYEPHKYARAKQVTLKMLNGVQLNADDEQFLLTKLDSYLQ